MYCFCGLSTLRVDALQPSVKNDTNFHCLGIITARVDSRHYNVVLCVLEW